MLRFKPEVRIGYLNASLARILELAALWSLDANVDVQINSIRDSAPNRVPSSLHPFDLAVDLEPFGNAANDKQSLAEYFRRHAEPQFDVVFETSHLHVEWDVHRPPLRETAG